LDRAAEIGVSEDAFWDMLPREFTRRLTAWAEREKAREEAEWSRTLMLVNHVRAFGKAKPISLEDLKRKAAAADPANAPSRASYLASLARVEALEQRSRK
jgi:hypothetical protein